MEEMQGEYGKRLAEFVESRLGPIEFRSNLIVWSNGNAEEWFRVAGSWHLVNEVAEEFYVDGVKS